MNVSWSNQRALFNGIRMRWATCRARSHQVHTKCMFSCMVTCILYPPHSPRARIAPPLLVRQMREQLMLEIIKVSVFLSDRHAPSQNRVQKPRRASISKTAIFHHFDRLPFCNHTLPIPFEHGFLLARQWAFQQTRSRVNQRQKLQITQGGVGSCFFRGMRLHVLSLFLSAPRPARVALLL